MCKRGVTTKEIRRSHYARMWWEEVTSTRTREKQIDTGRNDTFSGGEGEDFMGKKGAFLGEKGGNAARV